MRHPPLHRWMLRLALTAITLMVVVPSLGRLAGTGPAAGAAHAVHAGGHGGSHGSHGGQGAHGRHGAPASPAAPKPAGSAHYDCGYCPLLASLVTPSHAGMAPATGHHAPGPSLRAANPRLPWRHPWGLGSRGPPSA